MGQKLAYYLLQPITLRFPGIDTVSSSPAFLSTQCVLFHVPFLVTLFPVSLLSSKRVTGVPTFG